MFFREIVLQDFIAAPQHLFSFVSCNPKLTYLSDVTSRARDDYPPSNVQLLISHLSHQVVQKLDSIRFVPAAGILRNFARSYDRRVELHLDELGPEELMEKSRSEEAASDGSWKREAYVQHLASLEEVSKTCFAL